jgi:hypothetical protein
MKMQPLSIVNAVKTLIQRGISLPLTNIRNTASGEI